MKRLIKAARKLPPEAATHFDMTYWFQHNGTFKKPHGKKGKTLTRKDLLDCGSAACMAGWAATMPGFQRLGLKWEELNGDFFISPRTIGEVFPSTDTFGTEAFDRFFKSEIPVKTPAEWANYAEGQLKAVEGV